MITPEQELAEISRTRIPAQGEILGLVLEMLGAGKLRVQCDDGKTRICRIPGRMGKRVWINPQDIIIMEPWKVQSDERGDVVWKYTRTQANWLKKKGYLKKLGIE
ncbi:MAG: translation initiation factor eIF-1A [Candidatus Aenigmarchaeota archaeon]|nr:translation initiation factor eIF-1A [Candidatus Aenigmarchaeota archaeon]